ncbi:unnamed protein product [Effrenium voratum]|uniref:Globin family profile domain-containing protein n=1 Tax=Effrenium voratum TaxID=2562239 RepID=A0AA36J2A2_9DINO|nr:unnamed protein product [Effrenium voratum]
MFRFSAAVMGFAASVWMNPVLEQFDNIVTNVANSHRLQEECDVLSLILAKEQGPINFSEFKAVMLASLRSLVPKEWDSLHEQAWNWLWENVEHILQLQIGKPKYFESALNRFMRNLTEQDLVYLRKEVYVRFFLIAPAGQDYFKQSNTRLDFIADRVVDMTMDIFRAPRKLVEDISALGLRHVGYEVPVELFSPFVAAAVEVVRDMATDKAAAEGFNWALTLVAKILTRTCLEGSTIVMKAINTNQESVLRRAISIAPRAKRAMELLEIRVGTESISPFYWAVESGSLNSARAMIEDLLTIRADRDKYYFGADDLFGRHPEVIKKLCAEGPLLLPVLFDGLIWRSRTSHHGVRRVNYFIKHLLQSKEGKFNPCLEWLAEYGNPKLISHPAVSLLSDTVWHNLAIPYFILGRAYFLLTLLVFAASQSVVASVANHGEYSKAVNATVFSLRVFIYLGSMGRLLSRQFIRFANDLRLGRIVRVRGIVPVPEHLCDVQEACYLLLSLTLLLMCIFEPIWWCLNDMYGDFPHAGLFTTYCPAGIVWKDIYALLSAVVMLLYCGLITDLSIINMEISAFFLSCRRMLRQFALFLMATFFMTLSFALALTILTHQSDNYLPLRALTF